ncbi:hypothetical protein [Bradyrhizobium sp. 197]|uniref:hypothetical protein n=1 Tax=Bradyrhizobium sp. 197 TaxID=2782663 RepID=UPI0031F628C3
MIGAERRDPLVHAATKRVSIVSRKPMRQQFRHRRDDLHIDIVNRHVVQPSARIPAAGIDYPEHLAADHDGGGCVFELDRRPERIAARLRRDVPRNEMGMGVDCFDQDVSPMSFCGARSDKNPAQATL